MKRLKLQNVTKRKVKGQEKGNKKFNTVHHQFKQLAQYLRRRHPTKASTEYIIVSKNLFFYEYHSHILAETIDN